MAETRDKRRAGVGHNSGPALDLTEIRVELFLRRYNILPNRGKIPAVSRWNDSTYLSRELTDGRRTPAEKKISGWILRFPEAQSTGVRIEGGLRVIDIDVGDGPMVARLMEEIRKLAPEIVSRAPMRFGAPHKLALFCRQPANEEPKVLVNAAGERTYIFPTEFIRVASHKYHRPGDAEDVYHAVEVFGGMPTAKGNCSRQFGIYGPHSYNEDGTVAREYSWADDRPALHEINIADLPALDRETACKIVDVFVRLAVEAAWERVVEHTEGREGEQAYDIDEATLFATQYGDRVGYDDLDDGMRVASSFIKGDRGRNTSKCWVFRSPRHNCLAVYDHETGVTHYPKSVEHPFDPVVFGALLSEAQAAHAARQATEAKREEDELGQALETWEQSRPIRRGSPAERYLAACGVEVPKEARQVLRAQGPTLVALVADLYVGTGSLVGVEITTLSAAGVKLERKVIGEAQGGVIMLSPIARVRNELAIVVGFENGLGLRDRGVDIPIWALLDVQALAEFPVLPRLPIATTFAPQLNGLERLTIITDGGKDGAKAAATVRAQWEACGLRVRVLTPRAGH